MKFTTLVATALVGFLAISTAAIAGHGYDADKRVKKIVSKLELSTEQESLFREATAARKTLKKHRGMRKEMEALVQSDEYSTQKAQQLADEIVQNMADDFVVVSAKMNAFYSSLSEQQREKFAKLKAHKKKHMRHFIKGRHGNGDNDQESTESNQS